MLPCPGDSICPARFLPAREVIALTQVPSSLQRPILLMAALCLLVPTLAFSDSGLPPGEKAAPDAFSRLADAGKAEDHPGADPGQAPGR